MPSLLSSAQQAAARAAIRSVFDTFARPFNVYIEAQTVVVSTDPNWSRFGQHDQNVDQPEVAPIVYTITGCIKYANDQPYDFMAPYAAGGAEQLKLRESDGKVRIKVDASGHALFQSAKRIVLDGVQFDNDSSPRPHGIVGQPDRWSYTISKID